jgi:hypothetical protein
MLSFGDKMITSLSSLLSWDYLVLQNEIVSSYVVLWMVLMSALFDLFQAAPTPLRQFRNIGRPSSWLELSLQEKSVQFHSWAPQVIRKAKCVAESPWEFNFLSVSGGVPSPSDHARLLC